MWPGSRKLTLFATLQLVGYQTTLASIQHMETDWPDRFLLIKRALDAGLNFIHVDAAGRLFVADIAVKISSFRIVDVYYGEYVVFSAAWEVPCGFNALGSNGELECRFGSQVR